jgi:hypothetical protein
VISGLGLLQVCVFGPAFRLPFVFDDYMYLNRVQSGAWWSSAVAWDLHNELFRPGLYLVIGSLHSVFGLRPTAFHVAGAALVLAAAGTVGLVSYRLGLRSGAIAATAVYALHASMATPIGWASAANSPLAVALALGAVALLLGRRLRWWNVVLAAALFLLALMTREVVAVVPLMLVVARLLAGRDGWSTRLRSALLRSAPLWGVLVAYTAVRRLAGYELPTSGPYAQHLGLHAFSNLGRLMELATDIAPAPDHVHRPALVALLWLSLVAASVLLLLRRARPQACIGVAWFFLGVLPVVFLSDHDMSFYYVDLALVGVALAVGAVFEEIAGALSRRRRAVFATGCIALLVVVGHDTAQRQLRAKLYAFADITTEFVRRFERDNPRPARGGTIMVWYRDPDAIFVTKQGDLFRVRYHDPTLRVTHVRASGALAEQLRIGSARWLGVVVAPPRRCPTTATGTCDPVTRLVLGSVPTASDPGRPAAVPPRVDEFDRVVAGLSARRLAVALAALCFVALLLVGVDDLRRRFHRASPAPRGPPRPATGRSARPTSVHH